MNIYEIEKGERQIYGTQLAQVDGYKFLYPVQDFENLNTIRDNVGLGEIEEYIKFFDDVKVPSSREEEEYILNYMKNGKVGK